MLSKSMTSQIRYIEVYVIIINKVLRSLALKRRGFETHDSVAKLVLQNETTSPLGALD